MQCTKQQQQLAELSKALRISAGVDNAIQGELTPHIQLHWGPHLQQLKRENLSSRLTFQRKQNTE